MWQQEQAKLAFFKPTTCGERVVRSSNDDPIEHIAEIGNSTVDRCHYAYAADEEAAIAMGLGLGQEDKDYAEDVEFDDNGVSGSRSSGTRRKQGGHKAGTNQTTPLFRAISASRA